MESWTGLVSDKYRLKLIAISVIYTGFAAYMVLSVFLKNSSLECFDASGPPRSSEVDPLGTARRNENGASVPGGRRSSCTRSSAWSSRIATWRASWSVRVSLAMRRMGMCAWDKSEEQKRFGCEKD